MKIIIIGCPGSGKSVLTKKINEFLDYPVLHLDRVYHTSGKDHITRGELVEKVNEFAGKYDNWIIDGNYIGTLEMRAELSDTIVLFDLPEDICLANACKRAEECVKNSSNKDDMAEGFDMTMTEDFADFITNFRKDTLPRIESVLKNCNDKNIIVLNSYCEADEFINSLKHKLQA